MRSIRLLPLVLLVACGDNHGQHHPPDGPPQPDAAVDAHVPLTCGYTEMKDTMNDDLFANGAPEDTGISFTNQPFMICGKLDNGHYEAQPQRIDVDSYKFTVAAGTSGMVSLTVPGAENYDFVGIEIYGMSNAIDATGTFIGNYAVTAADLPAGDYVITITSYDATAPTAALDYKLVVQTDSPTRCAKSTAAATYTESLDGTTADLNDVIEIRYMGMPRRQLTANALDMPEPTGIMVAPDMSYHVVGTNSKPTVTPADWADSFQDRDTYQITMGGTTNQLSLRLNWPGNTADFDLFMFPMGGIIEQAVSYKAGNMEDEFITTAVTPGMSYYVWVGADDMSTGQPINYDLTVCGASFTQPN